MEKDKCYSTKLRALSKDYYQNRLEITEYRSKRKIIIDKIDKEFNGQITESKVTSLKLKSESGKRDVDGVSIIMKTIAFFKNTDS